MPMKWKFSLTNVPRLESHHQIVCHIRDLLRGVLTLIIDAVGVFYSPSRLTWKNFCLFFLHMWFLSCNLPERGPGPFHRVWHMSVVLFRLPCGVHIFGIWSTSGELGRTVQLSQDNSRSSPRWECGVYKMLGCKCWSEFVVRLFWWRFFLYLQI